jgi:phosphate acyltransferase
LRIGIDIMGSDSSPSVLFEAVLQIADQPDSSCFFIVFATPEVTSELKLKLPSHGRVSFRSVKDFIAMHEEPLVAVRQKKSSSLLVGIRLLRKRQIDALVTAGNTGALIASATLSLPLLPGIKRPALLAVLPTQKGSVAVIDVGGNVSCKAHHLIQFAQMGAAYQRCIGIELPSVGLLNIGVESKKGTSVVRQAYEMLKAEIQESVAKGIAPKMKFSGNIEGLEVFQGKVDVLVTDGFTGNVLLKTSEGVSSFIFDYLLKAYKSKPSDALKKPVDELQRHFSYAEYPGAIVCGVDGLVVKCHGHSSTQALFNGIKGTIALVKNQLVSQIKTQLTPELS